MRNGQLAVNCVSFIRKPKLCRAGADGKSAFIWLFASYVLQSVGELLIMPISYAIIGKLTPKHPTRRFVQLRHLIISHASLIAVPCRATMELSTICDSSHGCLFVCHYIAGMERMG